MAVLEAPVLNRARVIGKASNNETETSYEDFPPRYSVLPVLHSLLLPIPNSYSNTLWPGNRSLHPVVSLVNEPWPAGGRSRVPYCHPVL
jgi:hypothetical protein